MWDEVEYKWDEVVDNSETSTQSIHVAKNSPFHCYLPLHQYGLKNAMVGIQRFARSEC